MINQVLQIILHTTENSSNIVQQLFFKPIKHEDVIGNSPFLTAVHSSVNLLEELGVLSSHYPLADKSVDSCYLFNG